MIVSIVVSGFLKQVLIFVIEVRVCLIVDLDEGRDTLAQEVILFSISNLKK